jgi:ATP-dependent Clp protease ATP-binding subunit ClpA
LDALKEKMEWQKVKQKLLDFIFEKGIFRPELINRFDAVVVFKPLSKDDLLNIAELLLKKLGKILAEKEIEFIITDELKEKIVQLSFRPEFGARQMERIVQDKVGNPLAFAILSSKIKKGDKIEVDPEDFSIKIK